MTVAAGTRVLVIVTASFNTATNVRGWVGYTVTQGASTIFASSDDTAVSHGGNNANDQSQSSTVSYKKLTAGGTYTFTMQYKTSAATNVTFANRTLTVVTLN